MKVLIIGAGAVGGWISAHVARAGHQVTLVGRAPFVQAVRAHGLRIELPSGQRWETRDLRAVETIDEAMPAQDNLHGPPYDAVLVCVKAYDVAEVVAALRATESAWNRADATDPSRAAQIVTFQNGVGSEEQFAGAFGTARVIAGTLTSPVAVVAPGVVRLARAGGGIGLAPLSPQHWSLNPVTDALRQSLPRVKTYADYRAMKWSKLLLNIVSNASSAILGMTPAEIYTDSRLFRLEMRMVREALAVARAAGIHMVNLPGAPAAWLARLTRMLPDWALHPLLRRSIARGRGDKMPSFYYDVPRAEASGEQRVGSLSRVRCEVEWLNGAVVTLGRQLGIATPVNAALTEVLSGLVAGREDAATWAGQVERWVE
ncbi:MAG: ketopantoate reductase family protein, partial [Anaerolineae bacterium]